MSKLQLANYKKRVVEELKVKDRLLEEFLENSAVPKDSMLEKLGKAKGATQKMESAGGSSLALDEQLGPEKEEALRTELLRLRSELAARTAAERAVRAKARAARVFVSEVGSLCGSHKSATSLDLAMLLEALERFSTASQSKNISEEDFDFEVEPSEKSAHGGAAAASASFTSASFTSEAAAKAAESILHLEASLAKTQGECARFKEEASVLREKLQSVRSAAEEDKRVAAEMARKGEETKSRGASTQAEVERLERECARLQDEVTEGRAALDLARATATGGASAGSKGAMPSGLEEQLYRERDAARAEAAASRDEASSAVRECADARAREAAVRADVLSLRSELEAFKAGEAASDARVSAQAETAATVATELSTAQGRVRELEAAIAALEQAVLDTKAKSKADKEKLKKNATAQFDDLKAKALEEIERERTSGEAVAGKLREELSAMAAKVEEAQAASPAVRAAAASLGRTLAAIKSTQVSVTGSIKREITGMSSTLSSCLRDVGAAVQRQIDGNAGLLERYKKELKERRRLFNLVQELRGNIRVYCRVRPVLPKDAEAGSTSVVSFPQEGEVSLVSSKKAVKGYEFDEVFKPETSNEGVYREVEDLIKCCVDGYNVCIFAVSIVWIPSPSFSPRLHTHPRHATHRHATHTQYGQTGCGKTHTMEGTAGNPGVNRRALDTLFAVREEREKEGWTYDIRVSLLEIYNEEIRDMLSERGPDGLPLSSGKLQVRESKEGGMHVPGLVSEAVGNAGEVVNLMGKGYKNRTTFATNMNEHSSRSHAMLSVYVKGVNRTTGLTVTGKLHLVDLAGSERLSRSLAEGTRMKEAQAINTSLSALGDVIQARMQKSKHIPFRNSTLTFLLSDSLSNDSKTLMFVNMSPLNTDADESICSLNFASRV